MTVAISSARPRVVCISQARMTSTRLPGKVLMTAAGKPLLAHHLERLRRCRQVDQVVLATTTNVGDDPVAALATELGVGVSRGGEHDVLDRFARAANQFKADLVVRVTADCPLIDPALIDAVIELYLSADPAAGYAAIDNSHIRGIEAEVFSVAALTEAAVYASSSAEREHVTPYLYRNPDRFRIVHLDPFAPAAPPSDRHRWCVDEAPDFELIRRLLEALPPDFSFRDCLALFEVHPEWLAINQGMVQKTVI
ncbi:spore coat polysaccharide biosynthesis protein SpsF [uncultured Gammaproteobacteria bacterium]